MITQFAQEGYDFYVEGQLVLGWKSDLLFALLFALLALVAFVLLAAARRRFSWGKRLASHWSWISSLGRHSICLILILYLFICVAFGFIYHAMFQYNSQHFSVNASTWNKKMFEAINKHQTAVDNTHAAMEILALTVAGLRSEEGRDLLTKLAKAIGGHVRTVYVTCLSLSIVGPPQLLSREEAEIRTRFAGNPEDLDGLLRGQRTVLRDRPGLLSPTVGWDNLKHLANDDLRSMKSMLSKWLKPAVKSFKPLENYTGTEDTTRLGDYVVRVREFNSRLSIRLM